MWLFFYGIVILAITFLLGVLKLIPDNVLLLILGGVLSVDLFLYLFKFKHKIDIRVFNNKNSKLINSPGWIKHNAIFTLIILVISAGCYDLFIYNKINIIHYFILLSIISIYFNIYLINQNRFAALKQLKDLTNDKK